MAHVELSTEIDAAPQAVWDLTIDSRRIPELSPDSVVEVSYVSKGEVGVGTVFREKGRLGPMKFETEWRVTEVDPPRGPQQDRFRCGGVAAFPPPKIMCFAPPTGIVAPTAAVDCACRVTFSDTPHQSWVAAASHTHVVLAAEAAGCGRSFAVGNRTNGQHVPRDTAARQSQLCASNLRQRVNLEAVCRNVIVY